MYGSRNSHEQKEPRKQPFDRWQNHGCCVVPPQGAPFLVTWKRDWELGVPVPGLRAPLYATFRRDDSTRRYPHSIPAGESIGWKRETIKVPRARFRVKFPRSRGKKVNAISFAFVILGKEREKCKPSLSLLTGSGTNRGLSKVRATCLSMQSMAKKSLRRDLSSDLSIPRSAHILEARPTSWLKFPWSGANKLFRAMTAKFRNAGTLMSEVASSTSLMALR